jgi:hypothetical protein
LRAAILSKNTSSNFVKKYEQQFCQKIRAAILSKIASSNFVKEAEEIDG